MNLTTPRLLIRNLEQSDNLAWLEIFSSKNVAKFLTKVDNIDEINKLIDKKIEKYKKNPGGNYSVILKENNKVIGNIDLKINGNVGEIGYVFNDKYWCKGYCTESCRAIIDYCFSELKLCKICADCVKTNFASIHILKDKLGFKLIREEHKYNTTFAFFELTK